MKTITNKSERKFQKVMHEFGQGELKSHGKPVTNQKQALAIAFSEARKVYPNYGLMKNGGDVPEIGVKGLFSLDAIEGQKFPGYTFGDDWNGWATPYFEKPEADKISKALNGIYENGSYLFDDGYGGKESYTEESINTIEGNKIVYPIGAYNWTWQNDLMSNGGGISGDRAADLARIYQKGTSKELWEAWTTDNRIHFLMDHATEFYELMDEDYSKSSNSYSVLSYDALPSPIRKAVIIHHAQGMYNQGGSIGRFWDATKKHSKAAFDKTKELAGKGYDKTKAGFNKAKSYTEKKIHDQKRDIALGVLDETRDKSDTKGESRILKQAANLVEDQYADGGGVTKKLSASKKKILDRINKLKDAKENASPAAQKAIQKKIDTLQKQFDYNPSAKEKAQANKGKFALDVPASYSKGMYKKLWGMQVYPRIHKLKDTHSIVVSSKVNLDKAYEIYSDMLKDKKEKVPTLSKISRKL